MVEATEPTLVLGTLKLRILLGLEKIHVGVGDLGASIIGYASRMTFYIPHEPVQVIARIGDAYDAERGPVPQTARV